MGLREYNKRRHVHRLYGGVDKDGKTMSVFAYTKKEAAKEMRKKGFRPTKRAGHQTGLPAVCRRHASGGGAAR